MKKSYRILSLIFVFVMLFTNISFAAPTTSSLYVDGAKKTVILENQNSRTYISGNSLNTFGLSISKINSTATIKNSNVTFEFSIGTNKVKVNGVSMETDVKSYAKNNEVYVPLRFVMETLGYKVGWDSVKNVITATKEKSITYPVTFESNGNKYTVSKLPTSIVSLAPSVTETLYAIGAGNLIKGRTEYCNYPAEALSIKNVGSMREPNAEVVVSLKPELVLAGTHYKEEILNQFSKAKIEVVALDTPNSLQEMYEYTLKLGAIVDKNYEARALVSTMKSKVETVSLITSKATKPTVYYVVGTGQYGEYTAGSDTFMSEVIKIAGGKNIADDVTGWNYSLEKLIKHNPKYIVGGAWVQDSMKSSPNYSSLSALKTNSFISVNEDIFSRPSPRLIEEGLKILVKAFQNKLANSINF